jgi:HNH endonuclease
VSFAVGRRPPAVRKPERQSRPRRFSKDEIIAAIDAWVRIHGKPPVTADWDPSRARRSGQDWRARRFEQGEWPSVPMVRRQFGTFAAAIEAAGYRPGRTPSRIRPHLLGSEAILEAMREWARRYGSPPTMSDWEPSRARRNGQEWRVARYERGDWPSARTVRAHFGSFSKAVEAAGLEPRPAGRPPRAAEIAERHRALVEVRRTGPTAGDGASELGRYVRRVVAARDQADAEALGDSLLDLAAAALRWSDHLATNGP